MGLMEEYNRFRVIDAHAHNWSLFAKTDYLVDCLDRFRLEGMIILSNLTGGGDPTSEQVIQANEDTARLYETVGERIIPFCYVNAVHTENALSQIAACKARGFVGLKFWISQHATDPRTYTVVEAALELGWPVLYHSYYRTHGEAPSSEAPPLEVAELARRYPQGQFIMAHMGAQYEHGLRAVADCPNVIVDYAGTINEKCAYEMGLALMGEDRVVFGTDLPGACHYTNAGRVLELDVSDEVKQKIFADNILRVLGRS
ncbi:MAG: amidohydrolase family protein [bacterium]|nr:amidohydrolase family protein [bacterium]